MTLPKIILNYMLTNVNLLKFVVSISTKMTRVYLDIKCDIYLFDSKLIIQIIFVC